MGFAEEIEQPGKHYENQQTGFRAAGAAGKPAGAVKAQVEQMSGEWFAIIAGVRLGEHDHVGIIGRGVKPDCEPQAAGAAQRQTPEKAVERDTDRIDPIFMRFEDKVNQREDRGENNPCRP